MSRLDAAFSAALLKTPLHSLFLPILAISISTNGVLIPSLYISSILLLSLASTIFVKTLSLPCSSCGGHCV